MAGAKPKYRHLSRDSAARMALLRGLVTQLVKHEHVHTTYAKAKEAQRMAEKLVTLAKKNTETTRRHAQGILYTPHIYLPKLLTTLRDRYAARPGGYTRVLRTEPKLKDQAESAILEFVDGPRDTRFMLTARAVALDRDQGRQPRDLTVKNMLKVTRYRQLGKHEFEQTVRRFQGRIVKQRGEGERRVERELEGPARKKEREEEEEEEEEDGEDGEEGGGRWRRGRKEKEAKEAEEEHDEAQEVTGKDGEKAEKPKLTWRQRLGW